MTKEEFKTLSPGQKLRYVDNDKNINDIVEVHPNQIFCTSPEYVSVTKYVVPVHISKLEILQTSKH